MKLKKITLNVNGVNRMIICDPEKDSLADVLRRMGLTGTKMVVALVTASNAPRSVSLLLSFASEEEASPAA